MDPELSIFRALSARRFRAASKGGSLSTRRTGLRLSFTVNEPGKLRLVVTSVPRHGKAKNLTPFLRYRLKAGTNTVAFSGRLHGKRLRPGRYRLKASFFEPTVR